VAEAAQAQSVDDDIRPLSPPLIELAVERLESARRTGELAPSSVALYTVALNHVRKTRLATMAVADVKPADVAACLSEVQSLAGTSGRSFRAGTGMAKTTRAVLNRTFRHAVEQGWIDSNPVRDGGSIRTPKRRGAGAGGTPGSRLDHHRALTAEERIQLAWAVARSERAKSLDLRDLVLMGFAVGGRIGEVCALRWCDVSIEQDGDHVKAEVSLNASVSREKGNGIVRHMPKTDSSTRIVPVPRRIAALLLRRARAANVADVATSELPVYPNPGRWQAGQGWRDRSNTAKGLRVEFDSAGFPWVSFHSLRRTAVTTLADHLPIRAVADFAGHASIRTTLDSYIGRSKVSSEIVRHL
jgi:integrase